MGFTSYKTEVMAAMALCKHEFCESVGNWVVAEAQTLAPVDTGNLRRSITSEVMPGDDGVYVGVTPDAPYALYVEKGIGQKPQSYLEQGALNSIPHFSNIAQKHYDHMGGK